MLWLTLWGPLKKELRKKLASNQQIGHVLSWGSPVDAQTMWYLLTTGPTPVSGYMSFSPRWTQPISKVNKDRPSVNTMHRRPPEILSGIRALTVSFSTADMKKKHWASLSSYFQSSQACAELGHTLSGHGDIRRPQDHGELKGSDKGKNAVCLEEWAVKMLR